MKVWDIIWLFQEKKNYKNDILPKYPIQPRWPELIAVAWSDGNNLIQTIYLLGVIVYNTTTKDPTKKNANNSLMVVKKTRKEAIDFYILHLFWR